MSQKLLFTEHETCEILGMGRSTLRRLDAKGTITSIHIGRSVRYSAGELQRFVMELQSEASKGRPDE